MAAPNEKAFVYHISPEGSGQDEDNLVHQSNPHWVLTFVRWAERDTLRTNPTDTLNYTTVRGQLPLVVENDCIQVSTNVNKGTLTHSMSATLVQTDINYMTEVAPGDFVVVNMLNWSKDARRVANAARANQPINGFNDGFKGLFKVQSVRKVLRVDPNQGTRMMVFNITGFSFTEFNNTIYFQPEMLTQTDTENISLYVSNIGSNWANLVSQKALTNGQDIIASLIQSFIGSGISDQGKQDPAGNLKSPNTLFFIPPSLGGLLGVIGAKAAKDIYDFTFGIQQYGSAGSVTPEIGLNPNNFEKSDPHTLEGRFNYTAQKCRGESILKPEYWNQVKVWSILNQFTNAPLNELFTTFKTGRNGRVMPTVVYRQIPFTNDDFKTDNTTNVTRFMNIPRWKPSKAMVIGIDVGREEAARINFVQYNARAALTQTGWGTSEVISQKNYLFDIDDVKRSGMKPYIVSSTFDITSQDSKYESPIWALIVGDALIGGHLKLNGNFELVGIVAPIAVGDNFEFDGTIYHIEEVAHSCTMSQEGNRMFRTKVSVSSGISKQSSSTGLKYAEMANADAANERESDWNNNKILPGVSESQQTIYRPIDLDSPLAKGEPFIQPNNGVSIGKSSRDGNGNKK